MQGAGPAGHRRGAGLAVPTPVADALAGRAMVSFGGLANWLVVRWDLFGLTWAGGALALLGGLRTGTKGRWSV
jgi:hypothetical protein